MNLNKSPEFVNNDFSQVADLKKNPNPLPEPGNYLGEFNLQLNKSVRNEAVG